MPFSHRVDPRLLGFARQMRRAPTDAEKCLWSILRNRQMGDYKFRRQHVIGGYIVDFFCAASSLAIELDGGQHADAKAVEYDRQRTLRLNAMGVRVLRFWDHQVLRDPQWVAEVIYDELTQPGSRVDGDHPVSDATFSSTLPPHPPLRGGLSPKGARQS